VSVVSEGADSTGVNDSTNAFNAAISAAGANGTVWIPPGSYNIPGHITVPNNVTIAGAGMWYSTIIGTAPGFYGNSAPNPTTGATLENFAISGQVNQRCDSCAVNGIGGAYSNSTIKNIWIEHMKVGVWLDGPMTNLTISGMRIRDTTADGINFHGGVTSSTITNNDIRNTGDDGIALWADSSIGADSGVTISNNTVRLQQLANGIAVYGGNNNTVTGNLVVDTGITQGGGIQVGQRFTSTPVGLTTISNNTMIRDGSLDPNWLFGVGALWFDGSQGWGGGPVNVSNALIEQSPYEAVQWVEGTISNVNLNNVTINGTGTFAMQEQTGGSASFTNVTASNVAQANQGNAPSYNCEGTAFAITDDGGNSGISPTQCNGTSPAPVYPGYNTSSGIGVSPGALNFSSQLTGTTSAAQSVTVTNSNSTAAAVSSISTSGDFAQTNNCGSSIAANGSCTVNVTFSPTATGTRTGSLTINAGGLTNTVSLSGTGTAPGPVLSANPAGLSFPGTLVGSSAATQTVTVTNSGTTAASVSGVAVTGDFSQTNNCTSIAVGGSCTVTVTFTPTAGGTRSGTLTVNSNANNSPLTVGLSGNGIGSTTNLALNQPATASSSYQTFVASNVTDGNTSTYWESTDGAGYPQTITVDLGATYPLRSLTLALPPSTAWSTRTETLSVLASTNGSTFSQIVGSAGYTFNPAVSSNTVTISLPSGTSDRYVRLSFTANTGWSAAQLSELEVFPGSGSGGGGSALAASPSSLSFGNQATGSTSAAQTVTVTNPGSSAVSMSSIGVTGPFGETNNCGTSLGAGASCTVSVTFTPTAAGSATGTLSVASSAPSSPLTVALSGTGTTSAEGPYGGTPAGIPGTVQAANYDTGGQGVAYNVTSVNGTANSYRPDGVDLEACSDTGCGDDLGWTAAGQWFRYTVNVATAGTYTVSFRLASPSGVTDGLHIASSSGTSLSGNVNVPATGGWQTWTTVTASITLPAGQQTLTVDQDNAGWNLHDMAFAAGGTTDLALNAPVSASSSTQTYVPANATDGNTSTYWEATNGAWPATITVNLGSVQTLGSITIDLPPSTAWSTRTQTLSVLGSANGSSFTTLVGSATYTWNPSTGNTVTIPLPSGTSDQYVQLSFTANSVQNGAQASEILIYA
jgi:hypothetical protein